MSPQKSIQFLQAFCDELNGLLPGWSIAEGFIRGPGHAAIYLKEEHEVGSAGHVDVEFLFAEGEPSGLRLTDCVSGFGDTMCELARSAARLWCATSGAAMLELKYSRTAEYADHFHGREPTGLTGWHSICGAVIGYGRGQSGQALQDWWLRHQTVLPALSHALTDLPDDRPHGIKIFLGGRDTAEVRVDGIVHESASDALFALDWPRLDNPGFVRSFVIALHRES